MMEESSAEKFESGIASKDPNIELELRIDRLRKSEIQNKN